MKGLVVNMFQHRGLEVDLCAAWGIFAGRRARKISQGRAQNLSLSFDAAKIQHPHCGLRIFPKKFSKNFLSRGHLVIWSFVKIENGKGQNRHYNNKYKYLFYSEQMTAFRN